ncbi:hypothetical protein C1H46_044525 [Malus baccata]|uniref:Uncharacterized protein n=1 Tax=Malus baccata TaxID=106549 RepID=A0A540K6U8_MALBA|nr:hypothetical protein C1H46_044525 [Malus baccata]
MGWWVCFRFDVKGYVTGFGSPYWTQTSGEENGSLGREKGECSEWAPGLNMVAVKSIGGGGV